MTGDERLEDELRTTMQDLAREPAPDDLVARVAAIPVEAAPAPSLGARLFGSLRGSLPGFAAVAAVVILALAAIALRPAPGPAVGGSPSIAIGPTGGPTAVPTTEPSPSSDPSPVSSATPSPKPTASPTRGPLAGEPVPDSFQPLSVTFVSTVDGWALGRGACGDRVCPVIARTADGGRTWTTIAAPPTDIVDPASSLGADPGPAVSGLRFATARDGWAFGPGLWATHDGGTTWASVAIPGFPAVTIEALESSRGVVHVVFYDGELLRIATSPIGSDAWTVAPVRIDLGAGPVPTVQLVLSGDGGWVLVNNRVVIAGARLHSGEWADWQPPCENVNGPAVVAASSADDLVAACDIGVWGAPGGQPLGEHAYVSHDGGLTFARVSSTLSVTATAIAAGSADSAVLAGGDDKGTVLLRTGDGGRTWTSVLQPSLDQASELGFTTASQGVLILTDDQGLARLLMTHDGGRTWAPVRFQP